MQDGEVCALSLRISLYIIMQPTMVSFIVSTWFDWPTSNPFLKQSYIPERKRIRSSHIFRTRDVSLTDPEIQVFFEVHLYW